ncbi:hypothetical protein KY329_01905 [Candidatus Woesearchaeota archaeon]|nr:hypothetical protein [Candidatus Woesearchaeota archaeon]
MKFVAVFMVALMLTLPFAFAQEINIVKYSGVDNVPGFVRDNDNVTIEVLASLFGQPVSEPNVRLYHGGSFELFDACAPDAGSFYRCSYSKPITWVGAFDFSAVLMDNSIPAQRVANDSKTLIVDSINPVVNLSLNVQQTKSSARVTYTAKDFGFTSSAAVNCSGIKKITFKKDGTEFASEFGAAGQCVKQDSFDYNFGQAGVEKEFTVCAVAEDYVGHLSLPACEDLLVDSVGPNITDFGIFNGTGEKITHLKPGAQLDARVLVKVEDMSGVSEVKGNFAELTNDPAFYGFVDGTDIGGGIYVWQDVPIAEVSPCEATIRAKDSLGNQVDKKFSCAILADSTAPEFLGASSGKDLNGTVLLGRNSTLQVSFNEKNDAGSAGSGMDLGNAFLDLHALGQGGNVKADNCELNGSWVCSWNIVPTASAGQYSIKLTASDDLGNSMSPVTIPVLLDNQPPAQPVIKSVDFVTVDATRALPVHYDTVVYVVRSKDFSDAVANFSDIGGDEAADALACAPDGDYYDCTFESLIDVSGPHDAKVKFTFSDEAGNSVSVSDTFRIYALLNDPNPNYWHHVVKCSPGEDDIASVDRMIASQVGQLVSCNIELVAYDMDTEVASVTGPSGVTDCTVSNPTYIGSVSLVNARPDGTKPYLLLSTKPRDVDVNVINVSCPVYISSMRDGSLIKKAETENVKFSISFYNDPIGDAYGNVEDEIKEQFDTIKSFEWIGDLREWMHYAEVGCNIKNMLANVLGIAQQVVAIVGGAEDAMCKAAPLLCPVRPTPTYAQMCGSVEEMDETYTTKVGTFLDGFCGILNCQMATGKKWVDWLDWAGGGVPWCTGWDSMWKDWMDLDDTRTGKSPNEIGYGGTTLNLLPIEDSLIGSSVCLCLPGFIRNAEKLRQLECKKALCLGKEYETQGFGISVCDAEYDYALCNFIVGDIFSLIPFSNLVDQVADLITEWFADPLSALLTVLGTGCKMTCYSPDSSWHTVCAIARTGSLIGESVGAIVGIVEADGEFGKPVYDVYCGEAEEMMGEWEE